MILLVVGLVAVMVVVLIAVILSIRLGRTDENDEPDVRARGRDRRRADEDERWRGRDTRRAPAASARTAGRGAGTRGAGAYPGYAERGAVRERERASRDHDGAPRRPARPPVPVSAPARSRHDTGPQRRPAAADLPSAGYPSVGFGPAGARLPGDHPSGEFPAADDDAMGYPEDRPGPRRKAASATRKSRSKQRGRRDDDDDWPSTDWDKLSDEQYWAELSADKPLAAMAKPARPARDPVPKTHGNGSAKRAGPAPAARDPRPATAAAPASREQDVPGRAERTTPREPVTERLPVRTRQQPLVPAARREAGAPPAGAYVPGPRSLRDTGPHTQPDARRHRRPRALRDTGPYPVPDTGPQPSLEPPQRGAAGPDPIRDRDLATLAGFASAPPPVPGALDDDPLTSPSFSLKSDPASDSRSYRNARKHAKTIGEAGDGTAQGNGSYPAADYSSPGYAYQTAPPAAPADRWYSAPPAPAEPQPPAYGNPYQHSRSGTPSPAADSHPTAGYGGYLADPLRVYSPPGYEAHPQHADPAYQPRQPGPVPYADGFSQHPSADQAAYPDGYTPGGYSAGYEGGYGGDPYAAGGYRPYPPQG